ncbi:ly6/PLAUR domain-containing protein 2 isoform X1 [Pogona vitticeps]
MMALLLLLLTMALGLKNVHSLDCYRCNVTTYSGCTYVVTCSETQKFCTRYTSQALRCYSCHDPTTASNCLRVTNCTQNETMCKTTLYSREDVYPFVGDSTVTRSCALQCVPSDVDGIGTTHSVTCCNTDLCNADGAASLHISSLAVGACFVTFFVCLKLRL